MPRRSNKGPASLLMYVLAAVVLYVIYTLMASKPRQPGQPLIMNDMVLDGMDFDAIPGPDNVAAILPVSKPMPKPVIADTREDNTPSLTEEQRDMLKEYLPTLERFVHLDLKGAAPKLSYLADIFPLFQKLGATGLLVEWEDMFPYDGKLSSIAAADCYSKGDVKHIYELAKLSNLTVIPLVQTFGHMEFVLKGPEFKHLREHPRQPPVINPHKDESMDLIREIIDQQMALQPDVEYIHVGCDEVWALGSSNESQSLMNQFSMSKDTMFLQHVKQVVGYIKNSYPLVEVMMWDDMFRGTSASEIEKSGVNRLVTPVVWMYHPNTDARLKPDMFMKYTQLFRTVWIATAFKGATGSDQFITDIDHHYENHMAWLRILASKSTSALHVKGTMLTGWQRYDHFASLCELLPAGVPSLAVCLTTLRKVGVTKRELANINSILQCSASSPIQWKLNKKDAPPPRCNFHGHEILEGIYALKNAHYYAGFLDGKQSVSGWSKDYHMRRQFSQPFRLEYLRGRCNVTLVALRKAEEKMQKYLPKYFSEETTVEWLETYITPMRETVLTLKNKTETLLSVDTWPRRPIHKMEP